MKYLALILVAFSQIHAAVFKVATFNVELYVERPFSNVEPKSDEAKRYVREAIRRVNADVLALQEMGSTNALFELQAALKKEGIEYPHWSFVRAQDPNLHLAFLSKHPIVAERHHTKEAFLFQGRRFYASRGFGQIDVRVSGTFTCTLLNAHLKSKRVTTDADEEGLREEEAVLLREKIDTFSRERPGANLIVLGDLNDHINSRTLRTIIGRGKNALLDTRPAERNGDNLPGRSSRAQPRRVVWTHYYATEESYARFDYILVNGALRGAFDEADSYVLAMPNWGGASDHRAVVAAFNIAQ